MRSVSAAEDRSETRVDEERALPWGRNRGEHRLGRRSASAGPHLSSASDSAILDGSGDGRGAEARGHAAAAARCSTTRYDLADRPMPGAMMSGGRKPVQDGVRVRLPEGQTWDGLAALAPAEIRDRGLLPAGFMPLPHVKQATGGQVFPDVQIERSPTLEEPRPAALRRRLRPARPPDAGVPAADLPDDPSRARRRLARPAAVDPQLLRDHERHRSRRCRWRACGSC